MIIYFRDIFDEEFVSKFIPGIVKERALLLSKRRPCKGSSFFCNSNFISFYNMSIASPKEKNLYSMAIASS